MPESFDSTIPTGASSTDKGRGMLFQTTFDVKIGQIHFKSGQDGKAAKSGGAGLYRFKANPL
ncbi:pseudouridine synthase [Neisseria sp. HMSC077D05]|uniref:pseudouridine synthase n=1 Tax=Neisseria sp. HMSC077D05 TaxID=1715079 RepID=UPI0008A2B4F1|nr:pseudouridine synthase [Neisseria sp. HMSC077D05]OFN23650.1 pseudouridine synthase [Neisseria sp. HMSC077D05]